MTDLKRSRLRRFAIAAPLAVMGSAMVCSSASAGSDDKVFVCKFVGTPGVDERLQTGQNPISVSVNAIPGDGSVEVGDEFADAQGRSVVLAFDTGQPEPDVSECEQFLPPTTSTTPTTGGGTPDTTLANTGAENASVIGAALLLVLGGGIAMALARRRTA